MAGGHEAAAEVDVGQVVECGWVAVAVDIAAAADGAVDIADVVGAVDAVGAAAGVVGAKRYSTDAAGPGWKRWLSDQTAAGEVAESVVVHTRGSSRPDAVDVVAADTAASPHHHVSPA